MAVGVRRFRWWRGIKRCGQAVTAVAMLALLVVVWRRQARAAEGRLANLSP